ncbi:xylulokinase [Intrasporangium calvum]|uniref:Xylulose kinase n=1 Tax=Intrasporangium calvum (strain ATCC 23552 / DSM 43043 / JCM 3097 / NBRC 12989 / NCIMB 10167 / NRRL B-3866 / 7 KIP) TaxID=710696 RepID=E6SD13_INTC7|nr:xylulokinase [Intrasporangium calvum]ADU48601.1 xylulokinase [Intrasporangium calvum DSM 43043]AXG13609.1 xylulokinase [Intrasporangium calvum]
MSDRTLVAGIDSSTQSTKVVVCDAESGDVVRTARAPHPDRTEVDPERWWEAYRTASGSGILEGVSAIAVGGQQHGMVVLDEQDAVVRDALLWNDTRSAGAAADLTRELGGVSAWVDAVGLVLVGSFTVTKLRWLAQHEPDHAARVARVLLPHDWMTGRILQHGNGFERWTTDRGDASGTGYWSAATGDYRLDLLELAFGRRLAVPEVLAPSAPAGRTSDGMLVAAGTGDNMGAALGLALSPGDVVVSLGTSGTVFTPHDHAIRDESGAVAGFADATGRHLPLMCTLNAARVLTAAAGMLGVDLDTLDRLALEADSGAGGLSLLPYLDGERTPDLPLATGTLSGLTRTNATPANLARAAVEGMLCNLVAGVDALRDQSVRVERVLLIGGAAASRAVRAIAPALFRAPVVVPRPAEYVGVGAARQAAWALSGAAQPPAWGLRVDSEYQVPAGDTSDVLERYAALLAQMHGR